MHHILLFAVAKVSPSNSLDITSSDPNENIPIHTLPESDSSVLSLGEKRRSIDVQQPINADFKNIISSKPLLTKETLEAIQSDVQADAAIEEVKAHVELQTVALEIPKKETIHQTIEQRTIESGEQSITGVSPIVTAELQSIDRQEITPQGPVNTSDHVENMDMLSKGVSSLGDSLMNDIKSIATTGEQKLNDLAKETEKTIKDVPKNVIDYVKTSAGLETDQDDNVDAKDMKESTTKDLPNQLTEPNISHEMDPPNSNEPNEKVTQNNKLNRAMAEDDSNEMIADEFKDTTDNEVKFINNGVDVSSTSKIIQAMNDEINEMSNDVKNKSDELTMKYDGIINDELNATKQTLSSKMFQMKNGKLW